MTNAQPEPHVRKLTIAYDGSDYVGWQVQPNGRSIQGCLEAAWKKITGESIRITASGRTDAGVHAIAQVCSVPTETRLPDERLMMALNAETPFDIAVHKVEVGPPDFHAIRDAIEKTYCYHVQYGRVQDPLRLRTCWFTPGQMDLAAMRVASEYLIGRHDFASFQGAHSDRQTTVRTVHRLVIEPETVHGFPGIKISTTADGFLYNMVRNIVGTLVRIGLRRESPEWLPSVLAARDRKYAGQTAPAQGLFLDHVVY